MDMRWTIHLPRERASVPMVRRLLMGAMETAGVDPGVAAEIGLALSEACANVVEHAHGTHPDTQFEVRARIIGSRCRIEVSDTGPGFPPERLGTPLHHVAAPGAESGRGLLLIEAMSDRVQLRNHPQKGAVIRFEKSLRWRKDSLLPTA
ncbi:MAG TPA: ATP-binding protein [Yinghuangia sp.]|nr:ATP-binding protein [Yinghuangia sp.]